MSSKRARPFWSAPGAPLAPQRFFNTKNVNKVLQKWPQGFKIASKMTPRVQNGAKKHPKGGTLFTKCFKVVQNSTKRLPTQILNWLQPCLKKHVANNNHNHNHNQKKQQVERYNCTHTRPGGLREAPWITLCNMFEKLQRSSWLQYQSAA